MTTDTETKTDNEFTERDLIGMLAGLYEIRKQRDRAGRAYDTGKKPVSDWLVKHGGMLRDGESKIVAQYAGGGEDEHLDFANLLEMHKLEDGAPGEDIIIDLAKRGLLRLDVSGFKRQEAEYVHGSTVRRFIYSTPRTQRLIIDKER